MSVVRGYGINGKSYYTNVCGPRVTHCTFTVAAADSGGLGITGLKSNGFVRNVFMHTSQTPGANDGVTNPNPAAGFVYVQFKNNFNYYLADFMTLTSPNSGSAVKIDNSALTVGQVYTITTLGNATAAKWTAIGVPAGVTPAVGVSFVAATNGGTGNTLTSRVQAPSVSGVSSIETVGNPLTMIANSNIAANGGAQMFLQFVAGTIAVTSGTAGNAVTLNGGNTLEATGGGTVAVTYAVTNPTDGTIVGLSFYHDGSSVTVDGL